MRHETEVSGPLHAPAALLPGVETPTPVEWTADCVPELAGTPYDRYVVGLPRIERRFLLSSSLQLKSQCGPVKDTLTSQLY